MAPVDPIEILVQIVGAKDDRQGGPVIVRRNAYGFEPAGEPAVVAVDRHPGVRQPPFRPSGRGAERGPIGRTAPVHRMIA